MNGPPTDGSKNSDRPPLSLDAILELLANHRRRELLRYLDDTSAQTASLEELTDHLVQHELDRTGAHPAREQLETELFHLHLPKLAEAGVVEYDERS